MTPRAPRSSLRLHVIDVLRIVLLLWTLIRMFTGPVLRHALRMPQAGLPLGLRIRRFCETMGITYVKLGQYLAMRFDVLPPEICKHLENLFDAARPMSLDAVHARIESEFGRPLDQIYAEFEPKPLGSASIAQVHRARTHAGEVVAVKVQRPGIEDVLRSDLRTLRRIARLADRLRVLGRTLVVEMVDEFGAYTLREMDFISEGRTADRLRYNAVSYEYIPLVYWDYTSKRVLTLEFVDGISVAKACELIVAGREDVLVEFGGEGGIEPAITHFAKASLRQLFVTGFFHGDPHPGNVLFRRDRRVAFLDFGIFGALTPLEIEIMGAFIENLAFGNIAMSLYHYERLAVPSPDTDVPAFRRETKEVLTRWYEASREPNAPIEDRHLGAYWGKMIDVFRRHHVKMSPDQLLFWRALLTLDATALRVTQKFDILKEMQAFFREIRPSVGQRIDALFHDDMRRFYLHDLALRAPAVVGRGRMLTAGSLRPSLRVAVQASPRARRDSSGADQIAALLAAAALAIAAGAVGGAIGHMVLGGGAAVLAAVMAISLGRAWRSPS